MQFQGADYALCGAAALFVGLGLYRGFSGVFAFLVASVSTAFASVRIWPHVAALTDVAWASEDSGIASWEVDSKYTVNP